MKKPLLTSFLILHIGFCYGQNKSPGFDISDKWTCAIYKDTVQLEMIAYFKAPFSCGTLVANSLAICKDKKGDTLRIIEFCPGPKDYKTGQKLTFVTYTFITNDKKTYQKYLPSDETATEQFKYNYIKPTSFGNLQPIK